MISISIIKKRFILFTILFCFLLPLKANAGYDIMESFNKLGNNIKQNFVNGYSGGSTFQSQGGRGWNGGSFSFNAENTSIAPMKARAPSFSAGCGGISFDFGGFSIMDMESLGKFLESIVQQAPGYFVELALQILCPSCLDIMNTLQEMAQALNGLNFDSCATLQGIGNSIKKRASSALSTSENYGKYEAGLKAVNNGLKTAASWLRKAVGCASNASFANVNSECFIGGGMMGNATLAMLVYTDLSQNKNNVWNWFIGTKVLPQNAEKRLGLLMAMFGDIYILPLSGDDNAVANAAENPNKPDKDDTDAKPGVGVAQQTETPIADGGKIIDTLPTYGKLGVSLAQETADAPGFEGLFIRMMTGGRGTVNNQKNGLLSCDKAIDNSSGAGMLFWDYDWREVSASKTDEKTTSRTIEGSTAKVDSQTGEAIDYSTETSSITNTTIGGASTKIGIKITNNYAGFLDEKDTSNTDKLRTFVSVIWKNHSASKSSSGAYALCQVVNKEIKHITEALKTGARTPLKISSDASTLLKRGSYATDEKGNRIQEKVKDPKTGKIETRYKINGYSGEALTAVANGTSISLNKAVSNVGVMLNEDDMAFVSMFSFPFFKLLNKLSINDNSLSAFAQKGISYMTALALNELIKEITASYSNISARLLAKFQRTIGGDLQTSMARINQSVMEARAAMAMTLRNFGAEQFYQDIQAIAKEQRMDDILKAFMTSTAPVGFGDIMPGTGF